MKDFLEKNLNDAPMLGAFVNQSDEIKVEGFELIKVEERDGKQAINARELHQKLGSKQEFAHWIRNRIEKYGFVENQDFSSFDNFVKREKGSSVRKEYALSLDMAKELCMIENNEKGRTIRKYFIEVEKKSRMQSIPSLPDFTNPAIAARAWADQFEKNQVLTLENKQQKEELAKASQEIVGLSAQITTMKPKTTYFDVMMKNKSTSVITSMAQDYGMSPQAFNKLLHEHGIQHKVSDQWVLYRQYLDKGYVNSEPVTITHNDGKQTIKYNTKWTQKGRFFLYEFLKEKGILPLIERNNNGETLYLSLTPSILKKNGRCKEHWLYFINTNKAVHQSFFRARQVKVASVSWLFDYHDFVVIHNNITNYIFLCHIIIFLSYYLYAKHIINVGVREYTLL